MDARSIAATAANGGVLTPATDLPEETWDEACEYTFDDAPYKKRVYWGFGKAEPADELVEGPNIKPWPAMEPLGDDILLKVCSKIMDPVTTTDELIPSGETSSFRSNPLGLAEFTLSRRDPAYVGRSKEVDAVEKRRVAGEAAGDLAALDAELASVFEALAGAGVTADAKATEYGSMLYAKKPGDGSAREQAASCQRVIGGLANIVNEAALRAVRAGRKSVTQSDLEESIEVVIAGYQKKNSILTDHEKCIVAYHEIGHALVAAKQTHSAPVQKITIIPRTSGALGYTMQVDEGNHYLMNKEELENKIATLTGGRAAEEVVFHSITTGASNDIEQATKLARAMLTRYGMSDEFDMVALETVNNQYLGGDTSLACSAQTQCEIDQKVVELVKAQHAKAVHILTDNRAKLDELAQYLYQKETITGDEFMEILNREK